MDNKLMDSVRDDFRALSELHPYGDPARECVLRIFQAFQSAVDAPERPSSASGEGLPEPAPSPSLPSLVWTRERPTEADWYMVRGPGFRICVEFQEIAGLIWPKLPLSWESLEGCEFCRVDWASDPAKPSIPSQGENSREARLTAALKYARRFLNDEDHDTEYVDAILRDGGGDSDQTKGEK